MQTREAKEHLVQTYGSADYALFKNLKVGAFGSVTKFNTEYGFYQPVIPGINNQNNGSKATANRDSEKGDVHINYSNDFNSKHSLALLGVYEYNKYKYDNYSASARGFAVDNFTNNALNLEILHFPGFHRIRKNSRLYHFLPGPLTITIRNII